MSGRSASQVTPCPSPAAYRRHFHNGEAPCAGCRRVNSEHSRATRKSRGKGLRPSRPTPPVALPGETWSPVPRHPGYEASTMGRVRSVERIVQCRNGTEQRWPGKILIQHVRASDGRHTVNCGGKTRSVCQLVLEAFVGPRPDGMEACHRDDDQDNNRLQNLRWDSSRENSLDIVRNGNHELANRKQCPRGHALVLPNLAASILKQGRRACLACHRARARVQSLRAKGVVGDMQRISDDYYATLIGRGEAA